MDIGTILSLANLGAAAFVNITAGIGNVVNIVLGLLPPPPV